MLWGWLRGLGVDSIILQCFHILLSKWFQLVLLDSIGLLTFKYGLPQNLALFLILFNIYMKLLWEIIHQLVVRYLYQFYISTAGQAKDVVGILIWCL